jgi:hypothetical protein
LLSQPAENQRKDDENKAQEKGLKGINCFAVGGGFRYASIPVPYQFSDYPSVASTAWFVIAAEQPKDRS